MKHLNLLKTIAVALSCILLPSCSDEDESIYDDYLWRGNYSVQLENNDTGELVDGTATISLKFQNSGTTCRVSTGIAGMYAGNMTFYDVKWYSKDTFTLSETEAGQTIQYYSGTIKGEKMYLDFLSCDKVERTVELTKGEKYNEYN